MYITLEPRKWKKLVKRVFKRFTHRKGDDPKPPLEPDESDDLVESGLSSPASVSGVAVVGLALM